MFSPSFASAVVRLTASKPPTDRSVAFLRRSLFRTAVFDLFFDFFDSYPNFRSANDRFSALRSFYEVNRVKVICQSIETSEKDETPF